MDREARKDARLKDIICNLDGCGICHTTKHAPALVLGSGVTRTPDTRCPATLAGICNAAEKKGYSFNFKNMLQRCAGLRRGSDNYVLFFKTSGGAIDGEPFHEMRLPIGIVSIEVSPCGLFVLIICKGRFYLWGVRDQELHCTQELPDSVTAAAFTAAVTAGDAFVVVGTHYLSYWKICRGQVEGEVTIQKCRFRMDAGAARCTFIDVKPLHPDGSMAALDKDGKLMLFSMEGGVNKVVSTRIRKATAMAVAVGRIFVAGSNGVKVFDKKLQLVSSLPAAQAALQSPALVQRSPRSSAAWEPQPGAAALFVASDELVCARYTDNRLICWQESADGSWNMLWQRLGAPSAPSCTFQCSGDGMAMLATATEDGQVQMWKGCSAAEVGNSLHSPGWTVQTISSCRPAHQALGSPAAYALGHTSAVLAFSACRNFLAVGCGERGGVHTWDVSSMQRAVVQSARDGRVSCISWDDTGTSCEQTLACGSLCGSLFMHGVSVHGIPRLLHRISTHRAPIVCLRFYRTLGLHASNSKLLSCDAEGHVVCTRWSKQDCVSQRILKLSSQVIGAAVVSSAGQVALHTHEGHLHLIDGESGEMLSSTKMHKQRVTSFSSACELAFCGHECGNVSVCNLKKRKVVQVLQCHAGPVTACCLDPCSGQLLTACKAEGNIHFWDVSHMMDNFEHVRTKTLTTEAVTSGSDFVDNVQVLTECHSPDEDCGPIPSSFSPSARLKRHKDIVTTAASMPVWRTTSQQGGSFRCEERVQRRTNCMSTAMSDIDNEMNCGRLSMSALRTSVCRQELQKKRAQQHAGWLRNNLDDLEAMQHELKDNHVLRRSLTHVPISTKVARRSLKPTIQPISEQVASQMAADKQGEEEGSNKSPDSGCLGGRRASAPALSPRPLNCATLDLLPPSPSYFGQKEFDSMSSLTMPSPQTMAADLQQITGRSLQTPPTSKSFDGNGVHGSASSVMWNQNHMFKIDAASLSSGTRCTDAITGAQVAHKSEEIFNQQSPQPLWDASPDMSSYTECPNGQPALEVSTDGKSGTVRVQDSDPSRNSQSHHTLATVSPCLTATAAGNIEDSPLLAHAAQSLLSNSCMHGSRQGNNLEIATTSDVGVKSHTCVKVMNASGIVPTQSASPIFCRTTRRCLTQKGSGSVCSPVSQQVTGVHTTGSSLLQSAASSGLRASSTCSVRAGECFQIQRPLSAIPTPAINSAGGSAGRSLQSGTLPASSANQQSSCGSVTLKGLGSLRCDDMPASQPSDKDEPILVQGGHSGIHGRDLHGYQAVSCSGNTSDSDGSGTSDKEDAMSIAFDAYSFSQQLCKRVQKAVRKGTSSCSEAELRLNLAIILSDGCCELAQVATELCKVAGGDHESITIFSPGQLDAWKASRAPARSHFSSTLRHLERIRVEQEE